MAEQFKKIERIPKPEPYTVELKDLVGEHMLSGLEVGSWHIEKYGEVEEVNCIKFILDGKTHVAIEDPSDGYRSTLEAIMVCYAKVANRFPAHKVIGKMRPDNTDEYDTEVNNIIDFFDAETNKLVLAVGTSNTDDYYPSCVLEWKPENLAINKNK